LARVAGLAFRSNFAGWNIPWTCDGFGLLRSASPTFRPRSGVNFAMLRARCFGVKTR
jgi:hypothetical protein